EIQQLLDSDTLLLEYSLGKARSFVFAVTPGSLQAFELPKQAKIERLARRVYALATVQNRAIPGETDTERQKRLQSAEAQCLTAARGLSRMILGPVARELKSKRLLVVTDGALAYIPFSLLPEPDATGITPRSIPPLVVNHEIVNLPSASVLSVLRQQE